MRVMIESIPASFVKPIVLHWQRAVRLVIAHRSEGLHQILIARLSQSRVKIAANLQIVICIVLAQVGALVVGAALVVNLLKPVFGELPHGSIWAVEPEGQISSSQVEVCTSIV